MCIGQAAGARLGVEAIPENWQEKLENRDYFEDFTVKLLYT